MKKTGPVNLCLVLLALSVLFTGCSGKKSEHLDREIEPDRVLLTLNISGDAQPQLYEMVQEFARRAEYFSDGELSIQIENVSDILSKVSSNPPDLALIENYHLLEKLPEFNTFEMPYVFKNSTYMTSTMNSDRNKKEWSKFFYSMFSMEVGQVTFGGYVDMIASKEVDMGDFENIYRLKSEYPFFTDTVEDELSIKFVEPGFKNPLEVLLKDDADICEATLPQLLQTGNSNFIFLKSAHRIQPVFLLVNPSSVEILTQRQSAALQEAMIRAAGYCETLYSNQRKENIAKLQKLGVEIEEVNIEKYFSLIGDIYQFNEEAISIPFSAQIFKYIKSDACAPGTQ